MNRLILLALVPAALLVGAAGSSLAQAAGDGFLFHSPDVTVSLRAGYSRADAGSDVFDDVTSNLTLNRRDFSSLTVGGDLAFHVAERAAQRARRGAKHRQGAVERSQVNGRWMP